MIPRFSKENRDANQAPVDHVRTLAQAKDAAPGQVALAWLPAQQPWTVPIPAPGEPALSPRAPPPPNWHWRPTKWTTSTGSPPRSASAATRYNSQPMATSDADEATRSRGQREHDVLPSCQVDR